VVFWSFRVRVISCVRVRGFLFWSRMRVSFNVPVNVVVFCMFSPLVRLSKESACLNRSS